MKTTLLIIAGLQSVGTIFLSGRLASRSVIPASSPKEKTHSLESGVIECGPGCSRWER